MSSQWPDVQMGKDKYSVKARGGEHWSLQSLAPILKNPRKKQNKQTKQLTASRRPWLAGSGVFDSGWRENSEGTLALQDQHSSSLV